MYQAELLATSDTPMIGHVRFMKLLCRSNGSRSRADAHAAARVGRMQRGVGVMAIRLRPVSVIVPAADPQVTTSAVRPGVASVDEVPLAIGRASEFATARLAVDPLLLPPSSVFRASSPRQVVVRPPTSH